MKNTMPARFNRPPTKEASPSKQKTRELSKLFFNSKQFQNIKFQHFKLNQVIK